MPFLRRRLATAVLLLCTATAGCSDLDESSPGLNRNDLMADLAAQMTAAADLTYEANYQLSGGEKATVAQTRKPARTVYVYPGGKITVTADATTECRTAKATTTCTLTPPAAMASSPPATVFAGANETGLVTPATVLALLNAAVLDTDVVVDRHDTTIAGRHATCVQLSGVDDAAARDFTTCITNEGVLGSFSGILNQTRMDVAMTHYSEQVEEATFALPQSAKLVDRRGR